MLTKTHDRCAFLERQLNARVLGLAVRAAPALAQAEWEQDLAEQIEASAGLTVTEKRQVILARRGQGKFRERVSRIEHACRITDVNRPEHLIASHCKPWRDCESNGGVATQQNLLIRSTFRINGLRLQLGSSATRTWCQP